MPRNRNKCERIVFYLFSIYVKTCIDLIILPVVVHNSVLTIRAPLNFMMSMISWTALLKSIVNYGKSRVLQELILAPTVLSKQP